MADRVKPWILVAAADPLVRESILVPGLKGAGFDVAVAGSAGDARRCMRLRDFSLFVLDLDLPDQDGPSFVADLRASTEAGIIVFAGRISTKQEQIRILDQGADAFVCEPIDVATIAALARSILRRNT